MICDGHLYKIKILTQISDRHNIPHGCNTSVHITELLLTTPTGQGVTAPHTVDIFTKFFLKRHNSYWPLATLTQIKVTYHVSLDVTPQFRLQTQCNYTSHRTGGHNFWLLRIFFKIFFSIHRNFWWPFRICTQIEVTPHGTLCVTPLLSFQVHTHPSPQDRGS